MPITAARCVQTYGLRLGPCIVPSSTRLWPGYRCLVGMRRWCVLVWKYHQVCRLPGDAHRLPSVQDDFRGEQGTEGRAGGEAQGVELAGTAKAGMHHLHGSAVLVAAQLHVLRADEQIHLSALPYEAEVRRVGHLPEFGGNARLAYLTAQKV